MSCKACRNDVGRHDADCVYSLQASGQIPTMSKAQQAAEERYPHRGIIGDAQQDIFREQFLEGVAWALPENPDPAVIEAMAKAMWELRTRPDDPVWGILDRGIRVEYEKDARAAYAALRGAMQ